MMKKGYQRAEPRFSLCGLNCGLCPRFHTEGGSRCPGCGGPDFAQKHPSCAIIHCSERHGEVEFCFQCEDYPCDRYLTAPAKDSFITYQNLLENHQKAKQDGLASYVDQLSRRIEILEELLQEYNDGRSKNFFCLATNLLPLQDLQMLMEQMKEDASLVLLEPKNRTKQVRTMLEQLALQHSMTLKLRD